MRRKTPLLVVLIIVLFFFLSGCAPGSGRHTVQEPAGFFTGIWHGWIAPICLIVELFSPAIRIYEPVNTGWWYDFGYYMAIISGFGGLSLTRGKKSKKDKE
jgi:hypothetical protein